MRAIKTRGLGLEGVLLLRGFLLLLATPRKPALPLVREVLLDRRNLAEV